MAYLNMQKLIVYIQGDLQERHEKTFIVTVHDAGTDHLSFVRFADHPSMGDAKQRAIFLHVCVPGQENKAPDYNEDFPSLQELGEDLVCVLDKCDVRTCVALGEGAGAVIVCRFAAAWPTRIMGMILLRCTSVMTEVSDFSRDQRDEDLRPKLEDGVMTESAWQYYSMHKYGQPASWNQPSMEELKGTLNLKNFSKYLYSLSTCTEWSTVIGPKLDTVETLLVTGALAPHVSATRYMFRCMNHQMTALLVVDNVADVVTEAPEKLSRPIIRLCRGLSSHNLRRKLVPIPAPQVDMAATQSHEVFPLAVLADYDDYKEDFYDDEEELAVEEEFAEYNFLPKDARILRGEEYILNNFALVLRIGSSRRKFVPRLTKCMRCTGKSSLASHTYDKSCEYYDRKACGACLVMDLTGTFVELWQHRLESKNRSCIFVADAEFKLFASLCNAFKGITRQKIIDSELHPHLQGYLFAWHKWHMTH